ncbi:MAG TPA: YihY/virulence factor BrkB family protein [Candidatus Limnocylindria bacterium]|jgi:membrane protein
MTAITDRVRSWVATVTDWFTALTKRNFVVGVAYDAFNNFNAHEAMSRSAAIGYYSILSLFPFAMVALVVASLLIPSGEELNALVDRVADLLGVDPATLHQALDAMLDSRGPVALIGIGLLIFALVPWVSQVQRGIVRAFGEGRRSYIKTTLGSVLVLGAGAILILLSGVWATLVEVVAGIVSRFLGQFVLVDVTLQIGLTLLPSLIVFGVMVVLLRAIPAEDPTFRDVWLGALVTALGMLVLRLGFGLYVDLFLSNSPTAAGAFGGILVALILIDFLAIALLAGAEVAGAVFRRRRASS